MKKKPNPEMIDDENPEWTDQMFREARPAREMLPKIFGARRAAEMLRPPGRPVKGSPKTAISLRVPNDALARWKASGPGWQTRMAETLAKTL